MKPGRKSKLNEIVCLFCICRVLLSSAGASIASRKLNQAACLPVASNCFCPFTPPEAPPLTDSSVSVFWLWNTLNSCYLLCVLCEPISSGFSLSTVICCVKHFWGCKFDSDLELLSVTSVQHTGSFKKRESKKNKQCLQACVLVSV